MTAIGSNTWSENDIVDALPAYVLGALEPDEMLAVEEILRHRPDLQARVHGLDEAAAQLAYTAPNVPLPDHAGDRIVERARASLQQTVPARRAVQSPPGFELTRKDERDSMWQRLHEWWRVRGSLQVAWASAVGMALLLIVVFSQMRQNINELSSMIAQLSSTVTTLENQHSSLEQENVELQRLLADRELQVASIAGSEQTVALAGTEDAPAASATFYLNDDTGVLVMNGLETLPPEQTYQLWLIPEEGQPIPAGLLNPSTSGRATVTISVPADRPAFTAVGVSIEPAGGSSAPTGPIVLLGEVA